MVRRVAERDPEAARAALDGLAAYERAPRPASRPPHPEMARIGAATLSDHGGDGPPAVLIPSLINPPHILDLDPQVSLAAAVAQMGRRSLLLDWGPAHDRAQLSVAGHVEQLLVPLLDQLGEPPALIGYCLGGTMTLAAAGLTRTDRLVTIAAPWHFAGYPAEARNSLANIWSGTKDAAAALDALPMEVLQAAFWSLDPERTVAKFARFAKLAPGSAEASRFITLEDWANEGEPLPFPAARELIEDFFVADLPGSGRWRVGDRLVSGSPPVPTLHCTAPRDRITPAAAAPDGESAEIDAGHVGMIVGSARAGLHQTLAAFLGAACR